MNYKIIISVTEAGPKERIVDLSYDPPDIKVSHGEFKMVLNYAMGLLEAQPVTFEKKVKEDQSD
jgi:hypothetical protein